MNTTLIMNASEGRIQFVLEQEGSLACAQEWSAPSKGDRTVDARTGGRLPAPWHHAFGHLPDRLRSRSGELYRPPARADDRRRLPPGLPEPPLRRSMSSKLSRAPCPSAFSFPPAKRASA